jgi:hypothetical protein
VIAFLASRVFLPRWWQRLLVAAPVVLVPVGRAQVDNDVSTIHFVALYALFWLLLWQPGRIGRIFGSVCAVLIGVSSVLAVIFVPFAIVRMFVLRGWGNRLAVSLAFLAGFSLQVWGLATGRLVRPVTISFAGVLRTEGQYFTYLLPRTLFGDTWLGGPDVDTNGGAIPGCCHTNYTLIVVALVLLAAAVICAAVGLTRPHWALAALAGAFSVGIFTEEVAVSWAPFPRYLVAPTLFCYPALVALLRPSSTVSITADDGRPGRHARRDRLARWRALRAATARMARWSAVPVVIFALLFAVAAADNYRTPNGRSTSLPWSEGVAQGRQYCHGRPGTDIYYYTSHWWFTRIPCYRLR